jgi:hypothetical protein
MCLALVVDLVIRKSVDYQCKHQYIMYVWKNT